MTSSSLDNPSTGVDGGAGVRERPILFSAPMVRGLLDDRKTQTRRIVKFDGLLDFEQGTDGVWHFRTLGGVTAVRCPYGVPGDLLWVREAFSGPWAMDGEPPRSWGQFASIWYWADGDPSDGDWTRPKPSIHMPRWASRITLRITDVRVERLNDCSATDAKAEGLEWVTPTWGVSGIAPSWRSDPIQAYRGLWDHINGPGSWDANPWVWAVSFERLSPPPEGVQRLEGLGSSGNDPDRGSTGAGETTCSVTPSVDGSGA